MISIGRSDLVRVKPVREKKPKSEVKSQQELGCSDELTDSIDLRGPVQSIVKNSSSLEMTQPVAVPQMQSKDLDSIKNNVMSNKESVERQSTGEKGNKQTAKTSKPEQSKDLLSSIRSFFKR